MLSRVLTRTVPRRALSLALARPCVGASVQVQVAGVAAAPVAAAPRRSLHASRAQAGSDRNNRNDADSMPEPLNIVPKLLNAVIFDLFSAKLSSSSVFEVPSRHRSESGAVMPAESRVDDSVPFSALGLDSLDIVELMVAVERNFHIELEDAEYENIQNVNDIVDKIHGHPRAY